MGLATTAAWRPGGWGDFGLSPDERIMLKWARNTYRAEAMYHLSRTYGYPLRCWSYERSRYTLRAASLRLTSLPNL